MTSLPAAPNEISITMITDYFTGDATPHQLSEFYKGGDYVPSHALSDLGIPTSGEIKLSDFHNARTTTTTTTTTTQYVPSWKDVQAVVFRSSGDDADVVLGEQTNPPVLFNPGGVQWELRGRMGSDVSAIQQLAMDPDFPLYQIIVTNTDNNSFVLGDGASGNAYTQSVSIAASTISVVFRFLEPVTIIDGSVTTNLSIILQRFY